MNSHDSDKPEDKYAVQPVIVPGLKFPPNTPSVAIALVPDEEDLSPTPSIQIEQQSGVGSASKNPLLNPETCQGFIDLRGLNRNTGTFPGAAAQPTKFKPKEVKTSRSDGTGHLAAPSSSLNTPLAAYSSSPRKPPLRPVTPADIEQRLSPIKDDITAVKDYGNKLSEIVNDRMTNRKIEIENLNNKFADLQIQMQAQMEALIQAQTEAQTQAQTQAQIQALIQAQMQAQTQVQVQAQMEEIKKLRAEVQELKSSNVATAPTAAEVDVKQSPRRFAAANTTATGNANVVITTSPSAVVAEVPPTDQSILQKFLGLFNCNGCSNQTETPVVVLIKQKHQLK